MASREAVNKVRPVLEEIDKVADVVDKGLDATEKGVETAVEAVENGAQVVLEDAHQAVAWFRNPKVAAGVLIVTNSVVWGFVGWQLAKRHYSKKYDAELEREMDSARKFFGRLNKVDENGAILTPEELAGKYQQDAEEAAEALAEYQGGPTQYNKVEPKVGAVDNLVAMIDDAVDKDEAATESNIFVNGKAFDPDAFDLEEEAKKRDPEIPYVISQGEFLENDPENEQNTLTYYAGDDILADDRDEVVDNVEDLVGTDNLARFGYGSGDKNIVYIRNMRNGVDFEIAYSEGKYSEEVHGFVQHSDAPARRKAKTRRGTDG